MCVSPTISPPPGRKELVAASPSLDSEAKERIEDVLERSEQMLANADLKAYATKQKNGIFFSLFVGRHVDLVALRQSQRMLIKEEYNNHKDRSTLLYILIPSVLLAVENTIPQTLGGLLYALYHTWMLYFYAALALREAVLKANGSNIRPWWTYHHYYSISLSLVMLTMPPADPVCRVFVKRFNAWAIFQGVNMLLQNRYQRQRLYTRIALGKVGGGGGDEGGG